MGCIACGRGFHTECRNKRGCKKCHPKITLGVESHDLVETTRKRGSTAEGLKDALSTGRKRAAELYPIDSNAPCEWRERKNCGGGKRPIVGCVDGKQSARHHGPVKNTTRNHEGNVHRICTRCHNHWHELNDLIYDEREFALLPHDPIDASTQELIDDEIMWRTGKMKEKYELASSRNKKKKLKLTD